MACRVTYLSNGNISKVFAPDGKESDLYKKILDKVLELDKTERLELQDKYTPWVGKHIRGLDDRNIALAVYKGTDSKVFKEKYPDIEKDAKGDPKISPEELFKTQMKELPKLSHDYAVEIMNRMGIDAKMFDKKELAELPKGVTAWADVGGKFIQYVQGHETDIPHEISHFGVAITRSKNPKLYKELENKIGSSKEYEEVRRLYSSSEAYKNEDGTLNIKKLKEEAITQLVEKHLVRKLETNENPETLVAVQNWWNKVKDWFKTLLQKAGYKDPFEKVAENIKSGDIGTTKDVSEKLYPEGDEAKYFKLEDDTKKITDKLEKEHLDTVKTKEGFLRNNEKVKDLFEVKSKEDKTKKEEVIEKKSEQGHNDMSDVMSRLFDENNHLHEKPTDSNYASELDPKNRIYDNFFNNIKERIENEHFPEGTKFYHDLNIYNPQLDRAGSLDFLAVTPEGKASVWMFKFINGDGTKDISLSKRESFQKEIGNYKRTLKDNYGINEFDQTRVIPVFMSFDVKNGEYSLKSAKIGNSKIEVEKNEKLLPISTLDERTGDSFVDHLIKKLSDLYDVKREFLKDKEKVNEINNIYKVIRELQTKHQFNYLFSQIDSTVANTHKIVDKYKDNFKKENLANISNEEWEKQAIELNKTQNELSIYKELDNIFEDTYPNPTDKQKEELAKIREYSNKARNELFQLNKVIREFANENAKRFGIEDLLTPEKKPGWIASMFNTQSEFNLSGVLTLNRMMDTMQNYRDNETRTHVNELLSIGKDVKNWLKGKNAKDLIKAVRKEDKNELIDQYDRKFYQDLYSNIEKKNVKWIKENVDKKAFAQWAEKYKKERMEAIRNEVYIGTEEEKNEQKRNDIEKLNSITNLASDSAWLNYRNIKNFPLEKWHSTEYSNLIKEENKPVLKLYNFIKDLNQQAAEVGYIEHERKRNFLPFIKKSLAEKVVMGGSYNWVQSVLDSVTIQESDTDYGVINKLTGDVIDTIPKYFTSETDNVEYASSDLLKNIGLYAVKLLDYKYKQSIENQLKLMLYIEKNKGSLQTNFLGRVVKDAEPSPLNENNSKILEDYIKNQIYGQSYVKTDFSDAASKKIGKVYNETSEKINKKLGFELFPKIGGEDRLSLIKGLDTLMRTQQLKVLGFNLGTSAYRFLGTNIQALISTGTYGTAADYMRNELKHTQMKFLKNDFDVHIAALKEFLPVDGQIMHELGNLSFSKLTQESIGDFMMSWIRTAHDFIQYVNFGVFMDNAIVIDGKIHNAREYYRNTPEYKARYESYQDLRQKEKDFEDNVKKLIDEHGLEKRMSVKDSRLQIDGVDMNGESFAAYKQLIRQIGRRLSGNISREDESRIRMIVLGRQIMTFHNWVPGMMKTRFKGLSYNDGTDTHEWGRMRMVGKLLFQNGLNSVSRLISMTKGTDKGIQLLDKLWEQKQKEYKERTGKDLKMDKERFFDLVRANIKTEAKELLALTSLIGMFIAAKALSKEEEDKYTKGYWNYALRILDRTKEEINFFYNPIALQGMLNGSIFPALGVLTDFTRFAENFLREGLGYVIQDKKIIDSAHPAKYFFKSFPVSREMLKYFAIFEPDVAKSMGVEFNAQPFIQR